MASQRTLYSESLDYILELFEPAGGITSASMFGGFVIRKEGLPIALIIDDEIYMKVDDTNRDDYKQMGSEPFQYEKAGKIITVSNWKLPADILEDPERLKAWIEKSYQVAKRAKAKKAKTVSGSKS